MNVINILSSFAQRKNFSWEVISLSVLSLCIPPTKTENVISEWFEFFYILFEPTTDQTWIQDHLLFIYQENEHCVSMWPAIKLPLELTSDVYHFNHESNS